MPPTLHRWKHRHLATVSDWLAGVAGLLIAAATVFYWVMPTGTICHTIGDPASTSCQTTSLATGAGWASLAFTPLVILVGIGLAWLFFHFRHRRWLLLGFGLAAGVCFVLTFGIDGPVMPAALACLAAGAFPRSKALAP